MAGTERTPLLDDDDDSPVDFLGSRTSGSYVQLSNQHGLHQNNSNVGPRLNQQSDKLFGMTSENDHIVAVFVVAFDTKAGNVVEWCVPESADLDGVEFKAMPSGSHTLQKEFVYFKKDSYYGLSCFENMPVHSEVERGARMKSVGILSTSYTLLYRHMQFLESQVRNQLERPGCYDELQQFWDEKKATLPSGEQGDHHDSLLRNDVLLNMKITHPAGCFSQFIKFFGEKVFVLWKFALLGKRMIFFSPPPIGVVCYRVYCACSLAHHQMQFQLDCNDIQPHFYINVADIPTLETELSYIACTTEKIFETKTRLYDVYIDNQNIQTSSLQLKDILKVNSADKSRLQKLNCQRSEFAMAMNQYSDDVDEEEIFTTFFTELNNRLLQTLLSVAASSDKSITSETMKILGLDPVADRAFIMELVETYGIDVMLMVDNPCCPR